MWLSHYILYQAAVAGTRGFGDDFSATAPAQLAARLAISRPTETTLQVSAGLSTSTFL